MGVLGFGGQDLVCRWVLFLIFGLLLLCEGVFIKVLKVLYWRVCLMYSLLNL